MTVPHLEKEIPAKDRIIVALDVDSAAEARELIAEIGDAVGAFKIGLQLFAAAGPELVREIASSGHKVFLDLKFHDIPNTVAKAGVEAARLGVWMFNVHALGGGEMMRRTVIEVDEVCAKGGIVAAEDDRCYGSHEFRCKRTSRCRHRKGSYKRGCASGTTYGKMLYGRSRRVCAGGEKDQTGCWSGPLPGCNPWDPSGVCNK
jgi:hypothetical protein